MPDSNLRTRLKKAHQEDSTILAICLAERLLESGATEGWILEIYAANLIGIGRHEDAQSVIDRAERVASDWRLPWVIHRRAELERARGNLQSALELWKDAHIQNSKEATFPIHAATMARRLGRPSEAEELARLGTTCTEGYPDEAWYNLGGYLACQQRYDEALDCYEKAIEIDPGYEIAIERRQELLDAFPDKLGERDAGGKRD